MNSEYRDRSAGIDRKSLQWLKRWGLELREKRVRVELRPGGY